MSNLISKLDNRMNPIVVKELRQGLQSRFIIIMVNLLLVALSGAYLLMVMLSPASMESATGGQTLLGIATGGQVLFGIFEAILLLASSIGVPIYLIARLCSERNGTNVDLFFTASLSPRQIIRGKFVAGMTLITLFYSICLPFMLCTNLVRGFDIPTMLYTLAISYSTNMVTVMLAIAIGSWSLPRILTPFVIFVSLFFLSCLTLLLGYLSVAILFNGIQGLFRQGYALMIGGGLVYLAFLWLAIRLLGSLAVGLLSPPSSNRTYQLRVWATISIGAMLFVLVLYMGVLGVVLSMPWEEMLRMASGSAIYWLVLSTLLLCGMMFVAMCEPDGFSRRIMKDRPDRNRGRFIAFLYTYGASGGFAWAIFHAAGVWVIFVLFIIIQAVTTSSTNISDTYGDVLAWSIMAFACMACYVFLTKGIMRTILKPIPTKFAWAFFFPLICILPIAAMLFCFAIDPSGWTDNIFWKLFLPIPDFIHDDMSIRVSLTVVGAIVMALTSSPFAIRDLESYTGEYLEPQPASPFILATVINSDSQAEQASDPAPTPEPE